jgi:8-oxo-dGTP pyrophosphatase MutT (NUDIX family)
MGNVAEAVPDMGENDTLLRALRRNAEPALRRAPHLYWRMSRGMTLGVRAVVINDEGRVFLVKHTYIAGWHLPGGGVEPGETVLEALARELKEEGNIELTGPPILHGVFLNLRISRRDHVALFAVRNFRQPAPPLPNREIMAHGFFTPQALPNDASRGTRARIAEVMTGAAISPHW